MRPFDPPDARRPGEARLTFGVRDGRTRLLGLHQVPPLRVLFPRPAAADVPEAVILNTGGGLVGGDRLEVTVSAAEGSRALVTTAAAEKVYRSLGPEVRTHITVEAADAAWLEWLPQETILFDAARLTRTTRLRRRGSGRIAAADIVVFGRRARGERFGDGSFRDRMEVWSDDRLAWLDATRLMGGAAGPLHDPMGYGGSGAAAILLYTGADAGAQIGHLREHLDPAGGRTGATVLGDVLVVRWLGPEPYPLRRAVARAIATLRERVMALPPSAPRLWWT